ncbi:MAG: endonuclease domain-containing protein [Chloroflexota bacterium]
MMDDDNGTPARRLWRRQASRDLRRRSTPSEQTLWVALRGHRLDGKQFRRQHPVGPYIVDFYCAQDRLIVEIDGDIHDTQREYDAERDDYLRSLGYALIRVTVDQVVNNLNDVLRRIRAASLSPPLLSIAMGRGSGGGANSRMPP